MSISILGHKVSAKNGNADKRKWRMDKHEPKRGGAFGKSAVKRRGSGK